jgi:hypothetical protein
MFVGIAIFDPKEIYLVLSTMASAGGPSRAEVLEVRVPHPSVFEGWGF